MSILRSLIQNYVSGKVGLIMSVYLGTFRVTWIIFTAYNFARINDLEGETTQGKRNEDLRLISYGEKDI